MQSRSRRLSPQPWPWAGSSRVLIEHPDEEAGLALASILREAGHDVAVCPGPERSERCPLTGPEGCAIAHGADVVVSSLHLGSPEANDVLQALRTRLAGTPVIVLSPVEPVDGDQLAAAVRDALDARRERAAT